MKQVYLIGIDIGTQGTKAALYREDGLMIADAFEASNLISANPGEYEQNPDEIYGSVLRTIKRLLELSDIAPGEIAAVGLDAQMAGILGIDSEGNAVTPYDSWLDTRCEPYVRRMKDTAWEQIIKITGGQVTNAHGPKILWWRHQRPDQYKNIAKFVTLSAYVAGRLCKISAKKAYIDYTHLHFTGFADTERLAWDQNLLREFQVDAEIMPEIRNPYEIVGGISADAAKVCGLLPGIPVAAGCGDSAASCYGAGITEEGMVYDVAGTASVFSVSTTQFHADLLNKTILYARSVVPGLWTPLAYISGGGLCISWFRKLHQMEYGELDRLAGLLLPGSEGLYFLPHFAGRTCPNENLKGSYIGLSWNHTVGHLYRSILESIAYEYDYYFDVIKKLGINSIPREIFGVGGGTKSSLFNQIKADVLGLPYYSLANADTATYGSAVLAGYGVGVYSSLQKTKSEQVRSKAYLPVHNITQDYATHSKEYQKITEYMCKYYND